MLKIMCGRWCSRQAAVLVILRMSAYIVNLKVTIRFGYMMSFSENIPTFLVSIIVSSFGGMMTSSLYRGLQRVAHWNQLFETYS